MIIYDGRKDCRSWRKKGAAKWFWPPASGDPNQQSFDALIGQIINQSIKRRRHSYFIVFEKEEVELLREMLKPLVGEIPGDKLDAVLNPLLVKKGMDQCRVEWFYFTTVGRLNSVKPCPPYRLCIRVDPDRRTLIMPMF